MVHHQPADLDSVFAALADPTRRAILGRLRDGERSVSELAAPLPMSLVAVSKHLAVLEQAGLIERRLQGRTRWCRLVATPMQEAALWIEGYRRFWREQLDRLARYLEETKDEEESPCPAKPPTPPSPSIRSSRRSPRGSSKPGPGRRS
ncbi:MAG: metalloregulator ArsR/SmtB family transcription factor [Thermoanaerobaculia bacterium]